MFHPNTIIMKSIRLKSMTVVLLLLNIVPIACAYSTKRNSILFFDYDDWAEVYVDGQKVARISAKYQQQEEEIEVDLNPYLKNGDGHEVEIRVYNSSCKTCDRNEWKVGFEVYQEGEAVDYIYELGDEKSDQVEMKYAIVYDWGYI